jgi:hypothetical protein
VIGGGGGGQARLLRALVALAAHLPVGGLQQHQAVQQPEFR